MLSLRRLGNCHALRRTMAEVKKYIKKSYFRILLESIHPSVRLLLLGVRAMYYNNSNNNY